MTILFSIDSNAYLALLILLLKITNYFLLMTGIWLFINGLIEYDNQKRKYGIITAIIVLVMSFLIKTFLHINLFIL